MKKYKTVTQFFEEKSPADIERFVDNNLAITEQVAAILEQKGWTQKDLAKAIGKTDAEISKWLSGMHNLTLRSISKLEAALNADLITTPLEASKRYKKIEYVTFTVHAKPNSLPTKNYNYQKVSTPSMKLIRRSKIAVA
ncbi:MAG: helix-turn-helix transcriptional regulator [Bacteroidota bacterium]